MASRIQRGFTLVEVLVAVTIFSISIVGLLTVVATGQRNSVEAKLLSKGMFLAEQKMNEIYRVGYRAWDEDDENFELDETDEENPIKIVVREGEFYGENYEDYDRAERERWLEDYYWQAIFKESESLAGLQIVIVRVFNKNLTGKNEYSDIEYGLVAELATYVAPANKWEESRSE